MDGALSDAAESRGRKPRRSAEALADYERRVALPLLIVSLLYLILVLVEMLPDVHGGSALLFIDGALWAVFVADYVWRVFVLAPRPWRYAAKPLCLVDLVVVLSFPALIILGSAALGLARVARMAAQILRFVRGGAQAARTVGQAQRVFSRRSLRWILPLAMLMVVFVAVFVWRLESVRAGTNVDGLGDALWWAISTITTVGYGDVVPQTTGGRIAAVVLMLVGITSFGWLTAGLASLFVENDETASGAELLKKLDEMAERLAAIEAHVTSASSVRPRERSDEKDDSIGER